MDRRALAGVAVGGVVTLAIIVSPRSVLDPLASLADDPLLFGAAVTVLYLVRPLFAWPPTLCAAVVGYGYGIPGVPVALAGAAVTALPPFLATRWVLAGEATDGPVAWLAAPAERVQGLGERYFEAAGGVRGMTAARLAPIPADLTTCAAAASGVRTGTMVAGTLLGEIPWTVAAVLVGASAGQILQARGLGEVGMPLAVASLAGAAILLAGPVYRHLASEQPAE